MALSMPEACEVGHMGHPDFRVSGKIFATLGYPDEKWGALKLTPEQQEAMVNAEPSVFAPVKGKWGLRGATIVCLQRAKVGSLRLALAAAWRNAAPRTVAARHIHEAPTGRRKRAPNAKRVGRHGPSTEIPDGTDL